MPYKHIAYWLSDLYETSRPIPLLKRLKSTAVSNTAFPTAGSVPWTDLGPNLQSAFPLNGGFVLKDVKTSPSNNEHVVIIGKGLSGGFPGIAFSKDAGDTWVNPLMPTLANYTTAAQNAQSGIFSSPFDMTTCGFIPSASYSPDSVQWLDNNNIFITAGPFILKCSNWINYINGVDPTPIIQVLVAIHDNKTPDTQAVSSPVACGNVKPASLAVRAIHFETTTKGVCATDTGIFLTTNAGTTWTKISKDSEFQAPVGVIVQTIPPWTTGKWNVSRLLGVHLNGTTVIAVAQSYILRGVYNSGTSSYDFQPIMCGNSSAPAAGPPFPGGQCCPCSSPNPSSVWRSLNWYKTGVNTYSYYATGSNNKIYRSTNDGLSWSPWINPDTAYLPGGFLPDYQDISFYSPTSSFYVFGDGLPGSTTVNDYYVYTQSQGVSDTYALITGASNVNNIQTVNYMAVWVGTNPDVDPPPPPPTTSYYLQNCDPSGTPQTLCSQNAILAPYVGQVITNIDWSLVGSVPPSPYEPESDCWTVSTNPNPCPAGGNYNIAFSLNPSAPFEAFTGVDACDECLPTPPPPPDPQACFRFIECDAPYESFYVLITGADEIEEFTGYLGYVINIPELCGNKCLFITECDSRPATYSEFVPNVMDYEVYPNCAECKGLPPPPDLHPRRIKPGFYTPGCPPEYTVKTYCTFAEQAYDEMVAKRYGVDICCDHDIDKWDIRKQILELKALYDECLCVSTICPKCVEPCNVSAEVIVYNEVQDVPDPPPPCIQPEDPIVVLGGNQNCYIWNFELDLGTSVAYLREITIDGVDYDLTILVTAPMTSSIFPVQFAQALQSFGISCSGVFWTTPFGPLEMNGISGVVTDALFEVVNSSGISNTFQQAPSETDCPDLPEVFCYYVQAPLDTLGLCYLGQITMYKGSTGVITTHTPASGTVLFDSLPIQNYLTTLGYNVTSLTAIALGSVSIQMTCGAGDIPVALKPSCSVILPNTPPLGWYFVSLQFDQCR